MPPKNIIRAGRGKPIPQGRLLRGKSSNESFSSADHNISSELIVDKKKFQTKLRFIFQENEIMEVIVSDGPETYWDLQQLISKKQPGKKKMFCILNEQKEFVTSQNFIPSNLFIIKEFYSQVPNQRHPLVPMKWDHQVYHARSLTWRDPVDVKAEILRNEELRKQRELEEEERIANEFLLKTTPHI